MTLPRTCTLRDGASARIRRAGADDADALLRHVSAVAAEEVYLQTEKVEKSPAQEREWILGFDGRRGLLLVATLADRLVGSADFRRGEQAKNAHVAQLGIALQPEVRGQGLGRAMMEEGVEWARSVGIRKLFLGVFSTNERAIALYRSLGFEEEGRLRGQVLLRGVPADLLLMSRWL